MSRRVALLSGLLATVLGLPATAHAATPHQVVLGEGHVDVVGVAFENGALGVHVHAHDEATGEEHEYHPGEVLLHVKPEAETAVPDDPAFAFLGSPGAKVWVLPELEQEGLLAAGLSGEEVPLGALRGDTVKVHLLDVDGGEMALFTEDGGGGVQVLMDSDDGKPDTIALTAGEHRHASWAFDRTGAYKVTFAVTGVVAATGKWVYSGPVKYSFFVGAR
jgi:surface-anchored protein